MYSQLFEVGSVWVLLPKSVHMSLLSSFNVYALVEQLN